MDAAPASEVRASAPPPLPWPVPAPGSCALEPFTAAELQALLRGDRDADLLERVLAQAARARGALDVAVGDGLAALAAGERLPALGYSCLGDYAREVLGIAERTAESMARLSRELRARPLLRAAVCAGEVRPRAAQAVLPVAKGEAEAGWVERARTSTVRALEAAVRKERPDASAGPKEPWTQLCAALEPAERAALDGALELAGEVLGPASTRAARLEALAQEYLGEHPVISLEPAAAADGTTAHDRVRAARRELLEERLERETDGWWLLREPAALPVPELGDVAAPASASGAAALDRRVRELAGMRASWDDLVGHCAQALKASGLHRALGFASFGHYVRERLGLPERSVEQRAALERRLWEEPALRAAREVGLSYEKLRVLARLPAAELPAWAARAGDLTCIALRRAVETGQEAQTCAAGRVVLRLPRSVALTVRAAFRAVRAAEGALLPDGRCLLALARHFTMTWCRAHGTPSRKVRARDLQRCQVPGCSRAAAHAHHVRPRAQGGTDDPSNLVALCACHHLRAVHAGHLKVRGEAPHGLRWELRGQPFTGQPPPSRSTGAPPARSGAA